MPVNFSDMADNLLGGVLVDSLSRSAESGPSLIAFHAKVIEIADLEDLFHL